MHNVCTLETREDNFSKFGTLPPSTSGERIAMLCASQAEGSGNEGIVMTVVGLRGLGYGFIGSGRDELIESKYKPVFFFLLRTFPFLGLNGSIINLYSLRSEVGNNGCPKSPHYLVFSWITSRYWTSFSYIF